MNNALKLRKNPKKEFTKDFLGDAEAYLFELSMCDSTLAEQIYRELDDLVSRIRAYYG